MSEPLLSQNMSRSTAVEWSDIQGLLRWGYAAHPHGSIVRIYFDLGSSLEQRQSWLGSFLPAVGSASYVRDKELQQEILINIAVSSQGLHHLGLDEADLATFPVEFTEDMGSQRGSYLYGAGDPPKLNWDWGLHDSTPDLLFLVYAKDSILLSEYVEDIAKSLSNIGTTVPMEVRLEEKEHFGFRDGLSNPTIRGSRDRIKAKNVEPGGQIAPGEFIFGYADERGVLPVSPQISESTDPGNVLPLALGNSDDGTFKRVKEFGRNGSFLAVMQLEQHVQDFQSFVAKHAPLSEREKFSAKLMGRWKNGTPITSSPHGEVEESSKQSQHHNNFGYADLDRSGLACPVGAHIRRSNPRDTLDESKTKAWEFSNRHRILRRGRTYCKNAKEETNLERGLMFLALNISLARQFEHIQQTWINNRRFAAKNETDPIVGSRQLSSNAFTAPSMSTNERFPGLGDFVTQRGGGYFFLPSLRALKVLSQGRS